MREAILYDRLGKGRVRCKVCRHRCIIPSGRRGYCNTRLNREGTLYTLIYNQVSSVSNNPIEKKPLYHFYPGSFYLSIGSIGCNFRCPGCQNWEISHAEIMETGRGTEEMTPEESVDLALRHGSRGISWTFNEPAIWLEYTLDGARLAKEKGLYTVYVTNGYISPEGLEVISPYLDAFRVDIKGFSEETYRKITSVRALSGVLESARLAKRRYNMHVECVTNVTPTINDDEDELKGLAEWIRDELGPDTPWHVTRFYPHLDLSHLEPTPIEKLERIRQIGFEAGLHYVYLGNVPGHEGENTWCHSCQALLIERYGFDVIKNNITGSKCPRCGVKIAGRF